MFVEHEEAIAAAVTAPLKMEESTTHREKKKPGRPCADRKCFQERKHQINRRERKRMKEMSR